MTKYKKFILITYVIIAILMVVGINVRSVKRDMRTDIDLTTETRIFDKADLFSDDEEKKLDNELRKVIKSEKTDIAIVTTADAEGKDVQKYAEDFYTEKGIGYDKEKGTGILLLIDMDTSLTGKRKMWISYYGDAKKYLTNNITTDICAEMKDNFTDGKYYLASSTFLDKAKYYMNRSASMPKFMTSSVILFIIALAGTAIVIFIKVKNFGMKVTTSAATYLNGNAVKTNSRRDNYLGTTVTTRVIERNNDSGNESSGGNSGGSGFGGSGMDF